MTRITRLTRYERLMKILADIHYTVRYDGNYFHVVYYESLDCYENTHSAHPRLLTAKVPAKEFHRWLNMKLRTIGYSKKPRRISVFLHKGKEGGAE